MNDFEKLNIVVSTINKVLNEQAFDDNKVLACLMDDHGRCIHATISMSMNIETIMAISECFGDDNDPNIYAVDKDKLQIVFINNKEDLLIDCLSLEASF